MKKIICVLNFCLLFSIYAKAQFVGVYNSTLSISPSYTIINNSTFSVTGQCINTGTAVLNGSIYVNLAIDTSSNSNPKYYWRKTIGYPVSNFLPNSTFNFSISDVGSGANGYKTNGNGTTVIVWCAANMPDDVISVSDSASSSILVTPEAVSINEFEENHFITVENPTNFIINLKINNNYLNEDFDIELMNGFGQIIWNKKLEKHTNCINTEQYLKGIYYLRITNTKNQKVNIKKIILEH